MRIGFDGLSATIEVPDHPAFLEVLRSAAPYWRFAQAFSDEQPIASVRTSGASFEVLSSWNEDATFVEATAVSAACSVVVDVITSYIEANPTRLCLHCGSVVIGGRLVVFPSRSRAGKSTLVARLAAAGCVVYGDDVLPLDETDEAGVALGLAPRPRIPLPASASADFRRFIESHSGPADDRYLYLDLGDGLAPRGTTAALGAIILLDRRPDGPATLGAASRADTLKALIKQNFARAEPATALLDRLHRLMDRVPRLALRYSDVDDAAELIQRTFAVWPPKLDCRLSPAHPDHVPEQGDGAIEQAEELPLLPVDHRWRRNPSIKLHVVDGETFLAGSDDASIHHLNAIGTGLWNLLGEGIDQNEATAVLHGAFPDTDRGVIGRDVAGLFSALAAAGVIVPSKDPTSRRR